MEACTAVDRSMPPIKKLDTTLKDFWLPPERNSLTSDSSMVKRPLRYLLQNRTCVMECKLLLQ